MNKPIFLDHHATTPLDPRVFEAMLPYFVSEFGNASSTTHVYGWRARNAVEKARTQVASLINCHPSEIIFTSGATESNRLILSRYRILTSPIEHPSMLLNPLHPGEGEFDLSKSGEGLLIRPDVIFPVLKTADLISVMLAHNEIGTINPVAELASFSHYHNLLFHSDITQAVGRIPVDVKQLNLDFASLSAHKIYGPKGAGALFCRPGLDNFIETGTLNVPAIVGFGAAAEIAQREMLVESARIMQLRDRLEQQLPFVLINGSPTHRLPGNLNISFPNVDGELLMLNIQNDIAVSQGAACLSKRNGQSPTLIALGLSPQLAQATLRIGIGRFNNEGEIDHCVAVLKTAYQSVLRAFQYHEGEHDKL